MSRFASFRRVVPPLAAQHSLPETQPIRDLRLDFFRGVSLILIFIDHIPENVLSYFTLQAATFFDAAEPLPRKRSHSSLE